MINQILEESQLSAPAMEKIVNALQEEIIPKGEILLREGQVCKHLYLVKKGILRMYYIDSSGRDITHWFSDEQHIMCAPNSYFNRTASHYYIEALEDVEVNMISLDQLNSLFKDSHEIERLGRLLTLQMLTLINDKLLSLQFKTAKERYVSMLHLHPDIFNRVSLGHISSYIGITPQSLSRIRTEL
jgi:CRP-like cAMP-binding protein